MKFKILVDNKTEKSRCKAEWGLAIAIETEGHKILFDTGASSMFADNAKALGVDLSEMEALVISHGHYDHTEGVPAFIEINETAPIYLHKNALGDIFGEEDGKIDEDSCGILWDGAFTEKVRSRIQFGEGVYKIFDNVTVVGNIPWHPAFSATERFFRKIHVTDADGNAQLSFVQDEMDHEQFLVVEEGDTIHIFSGCSHKGVIATLEYAQKLFPGKKIGSLIAGMHMYPLKSRQQDEIIDAMLKMDVEWLVPLHCTGMEAIIKMKMKKGEKCLIASSGKSYEFYPQIP